MKKELTPFGASRIKGGDITIYMYDKDGNVLTKIIKKKI